MAMEAVEAPHRGFISSEPAETWEEGLICGNGTIGANMFSQPLDETIIFTHEDVFLPQGPPMMPPKLAPRLFEIRRLIDRGLYFQAAQLAFDLSGQSGFMYPDAFVPAFDLRMQMDSAGEVSDYVRSVDFQTGEAVVRWSDDRGTFARRLFVSRRDGLAVMLITGSKKGSVGFRLTLQPRQPSEKLGEKTVERSREVFESHVGNVEIVAQDSAVTFRNGFTKAYPAAFTRWKVSPLLTPRADGLNHPEGKWSWLEPIRLWCSSTWSRCTTRRSHSSGPCATPSAGCRTTSAPC